MIPPCPIRTLRGQVALVHHRPKFQLRSARIFFRSLAE